MRGTFDALAPAFGRLPAAGLDAKPDDEPPKHGMGPPKIGVHACARGPENCPFCRYGFPRERLPRGASRGMVMEKGDKEGQWHAHFPRNDRLCCSYEAHVLMANMGNIDWRPVLNLWAVVQYVTKYATKAPKGSRRLNEVLQDLSHIHI